MCSAWSCSHVEFDCGPEASRECIPERWVCDGDNDCGNNRDEDQETCGQCVENITNVIVVVVVVVVVVVI